MFVYPVDTLQKTFDRSFAVPNHKTNPANPAIPDRVVSILRVQLAQSFLGGPMSRDLGV